MQQLEVIGHEFSVRYRLVGEDGRPSKMFWRFFPTASALLTFLQRLDSIDSRQVVPGSVTVARRPLGAWQGLTLHDLEGLAAEERGS